MKKQGFIIISFLLIFFHTTNAQDLSLDEILANYFEATGLEQMKSVSSIQAKGKSLAMAQEYPFSMIMKRPHKNLLKVDFQGQKMIRCFDGETGWAVEPWVSPDARDYNEFEIRAAKIESDFEGPLYNYEEKGHQLELLGIEEVEGTETYALKLTTEKGDELTFYIDTENFVILKQHSKMMFNDQPVEMDTYMSNYKKIEGMVMAFSVETRMNGQTVSNVTMEEVTFNNEIDDAVFMKPVKE